MQLGKKQYKVKVQHVSLLEILNRLYLINPCLPLLRMASNML